MNLALVTGASRGFGAAMVEELAFRGWHVVAVARTVGGLEEVDDRIKSAIGRATLAPMDITDEGAMQHLCRSIHDRWGGLQLWVHAAIHAAPLSPAAHLDMKDWDKSVTINARATGMLIPLVEPLLRAGNGTALFLDDPKGGSQYHAAYGATKAAQIALARSWQAETHRTGPRVVVAEPMPMPTATRARFFPGEDRIPLAPPRDEASRILTSVLQPVTQE